MINNITKSLQHNPMLMMAFMFGIMMVLGLFDPLMAVDNPLEVMNRVALKQTTDNVLPMAIMWIIGFSAVFAFALKSPYPLFLGAIAVLFLAMGPELAPTFADYNFTAQ